MNIVSDLLNEAYRIAEAQEDLTEMRAAVRNSLRNLADAGVLTEEEEKQVAEMYPRIRRIRRGTTTTEEE